MSIVYRMNRRVQIADTDFAGVLHFSNYFRFMEEIECAFWRSLGPGIISTQDGAQVSWPRVAVSCEYSEPARFEDEIELVLRIKNIGDRSASYEVEFLRDGRRIARGTSKGACCSMADGVFQSIPIPATLRTVLENALTSGK